jgi:mycothiol synthase
MRTDVIERTHIGQLTDLMNRTCDLEYNRFTPELIRHRVWEFPGLFAEGRLGVFDGDRLVAAMVGGLSGTEGFIRLFAVDQAERGKGLGNRLLLQIEDLLRRRGAREIAVLYSAPGYFTPGLDPRYTPALCLLEKHGYERIDVVSNMLIPLRSGRLFDTDAARVEAGLRAHGIELRRATPEDRPRVREWMAKEFPGGWEAEADVTFTLSPIPLWLAFRGEAIVGFVAYDEDLFAGGFGPTGVEESLRGRGIGVALLYRSLAEMQAIGYTECEVGWIGPARFYSRAVEARVNRSFYQFRKLLT